MSQSAKYLCQIDDYLTKILESRHSSSVLLEAMRYVSLSGGKRIRPLLVIAGGLLSSAPFEILVKFGSALELIHCYSLVHDDLPAMDNDDLRRGIPTCHKKYNESIAILVGDALQALAFELLASNEQLLDPINQLKIIRLIANSAGVDGMVGGQVLDLQATGQKLSLLELQEMHLMKTGALIKAALLSGFLCGTVTDDEKYNQLASIANNIGLLFQIIDDIIDTTESSVTLGKTANKDLVNNKATYVSVLGLELSKCKANELYSNIMNNLDAFPESELLKELTTMIYKRKR